MLSRLLGRRSAPQSLPNATLPPGFRVYAIGDMHGRLDLFEALMAAIEADHRARPAARCVIVGLGDYIDRGPHSARLLDRLADGPPDWAEWVLLTGNHEYILLQILDAASPDDVAPLVASWKTFGGVEALLSWGASSVIAMGDDHAGSAAFIRAAVSDRQRGFLRGLPTSYALGGYFFAHAGVRPGVPLAEQQIDDLLWIRGEFLSSDADHGAVVVHGHTPAAGPEARANRIGIDTDAWMSGRLTAVALEGAGYRFIQTGS